MKPEKSKYLDILKVLDLGAEGGSETLYRLLPMGKVNFVWRTYGNSINEDVSGEEVWADFSNEYESLTEYLNQRSSILAGMVPLYIDHAFRGEIFQELLVSLREQGAADYSKHLFRDKRRWGLDGTWLEWQKHLQLQADYHTVTLYSAIAPTPITELKIDLAAVKNVQMLLNCVYNALLAGLKPQGSYGKQWVMYDLVHCRELMLPRDDRGDSLRDIGITGGGVWIVVGV